MREYWTHGYTRSELEAAQERFGLLFPPDLFDLLLERRPIHGWNWRKDEAGIRDMLARPLEGLLFDVEHNDLWWPEWGERPARRDERAEIVSAVVKAAPRLIPIISHRYIPEKPHEAGNPVFSVVQSDIIYYGRNLADFFRSEFPPGFAIEGHTGGELRHIPFWSDMVERNLLTGPCSRTAAAPLSSGRCRHCGSGPASRCSSALLRG